MLRTRYSKEASNYLFDNSSLVFELQVTVEDLVFSNGVPREGFHYVDPFGTHVWEIMDHIVVYRIEGRFLIVETVMPVN